MVCPTFRGPIITGGFQTTKFVKVFSLENFPTWYQPWPCPQAAPSFSVLHTEGRFMILYSHRLNTCMTRRVYWTSWRVPMSPQTSEELSAMTTRTGFITDWYAELSYIVTMCTINWKIVIVKIFSDSMENV